MSTSGTPIRAAPDGRPVDRNGFYLSEDQVDAGVDAAGELLVLTKEQMEIFRRREKKWQVMLKEWSHWMPKKRDKVKARCRKGIPNSLRGWAWRCLCGADQLEVNAPPGRFNQLVAEAEHPVNATGPMAEYLEIIERDLDRTFPHNDRFSVKGGEAQEELRKVLRALTMANKEVGYCQGMGMIVGTLMMQMPTEQAFWSMTALMDPGLGYIHGVFDSGLSEIQICGQVLRNLMKTHLPVIYAKFEAEMFEPVLYMVDWFMVCFVKTLPWASVLRVWDMFMFEGMKIIYRVSLAILRLSKKELIKKSNGMGELMMYLKNLPDGILVPDVLMPVALDISITTKEIATLHRAAKAEYEKTHPPKPKEEKKPSAASSHPPYAAVAFSSPAGSARPSASSSLDVSDEGPQSHAADESAQPQDPAAAILPPLATDSADTAELQGAVSTFKISEEPSDATAPDVEELPPDTGARSDVDDGSDIDLDDTIGDWRGAVDAEPMGVEAELKTVEVQLIAVREV